ncbi:MAG: aminoacyl-tRNA hydrolase [Alphaproteobacteria bacterium]
MLLLVGLGNPGPEHARQRHNVGFMALERIIDRQRLGVTRVRFQGQVNEGALAGEKVLGLRPMTYMNESGRAVAEAMRFYKLTPDDVVVIHDELDLAPGKLRVKQGGGAAGNNGIRSVMRHIGPDFRRVRIGVGHPGHKDAVLRHVLHDFSKVELQWLEPLLDAIAEAAPLLAQGDDPGFATRVALLRDPPDNFGRGKRADA